MVTSVNNVNSPQSLDQTTSNNNNVNNQTGKFAGLTVARTADQADRPAQLNSAISATQKATQATTGLSNGQQGTLYPPSGDNGGAHTIFVNGIGTSSGSASGQAQNIANDTNAPVDLVYQYTDRTSKILSDIGKLALPFGGSSVDKIKQSLDNPAAANTLANNVISQLGGPNGTNQVHLVGYSQGAHISAEALNQVNNQLTQQYGKDVAKQMMSRVHMLDMGGAAGHKEFPPGVNLLQVSHASDPVSMFLGDNNVFNGQHPHFPDLSFNQHTNYFNDPAVANVISQWQKGQIDNRIMQLNDYHG